MPGRSCPLKKYQGTYHSCRFILSLLALFPYCFPRSALAPPHCSSKQFPYNMALCDLRSAGPPTYVHILVIVPHCFRFSARFCAKAASRRSRPAGQTPQRTPVPVMGSAARAAEAIPAEPPSATSVLFLSVRSTRPAAPAPRTRSALHGRRSCYTPPAAPAGPWMCA